MSNTKLLSRFYCKKCDYSTSKKSSWNKHLKTKKHTTKVAEKPDIIYQNIQKLPKNKKFKCKKCRNTINR